MKTGEIFESAHQLWHSPAESMQKPGPLLQLVLIGFGIGLLSGAVISVFRITTDFVYTWVIHWTGKGDLRLHFVWIGLAILGGLAVGQLIRDPAIRFGGASWIRKALEEGQPRAWRLVLLPKFIGSWLVMAFGISVGREGPCIQMGASTALGIHKIAPREVAERRFYILGGSACGLAAAFSAPFAGICYVYEVMNQKLDRSLFIFMLAGGIGVYVSCTQIFGLGVMLPLESAMMPDLSRSWILIPLGICAGFVGIAYNLLLRLSIKCWEGQKLVPIWLRPAFTFLAAGLMVIYFPAVTGEGLTVFPGMESGQLLVNYLGIFLLVKLVFTAFCYGSGIPAGIMVPVLCLGGVMGGIYADWLQHFDLLAREEMFSCVVMGMAAAFAAAEKAPVTALVLVAEMTGAYASVPGLLIASACATYLARLCRIKSV